MSEQEVEVGLGKSNVNSTPQNATWDATVIDKLPTTTFYPTNSLQFLHKLEKERLNESAKEPPIPEANVQLRIVIVSAGLDGLATSIALAQCGHRVIVLEQAQQLSKVGADVQIPSNVARLLERWGVLPFLVDKAAEPHDITLQSFGAPSYVVHRAHFHEALYERAKELGVDVRVNSKVVKYDLEAPAAMMENNTILRADLVVAADEVNSTARRFILGGTGQAPTPAGFYSILDQLSLNLWIGPDGHVMTYTMAAGSSFSLSDIQDMRRDFADWDLKLVKIINMVEKTMKRPLLAGPPLPTWLAPSCRILILGDTAHSMLPYMSQAAAMAVKDGAALATVLNFIEDRDALPFALRTLGRERLKRASHMQEASRGKHFMVSANQRSDPVTQLWAYGYDPKGAMKKAWKAVIRNGCEFKRWQN
ncbi:related to salicylate hydroxylase [Phialocephala subalpina]|uniref:Related to salicylate hydroxylase n=1 Tax=Phialocephala subalpina TaxID=576137 RepID=A0A1L7XPK1_9HELO|nr:related to salicylate hydroxylase [Phialocephala subalpina]